MLLFVFPALDTAVQGSIGQAPKARVVYIGLIAGAACYVVGMLVAVFRKEQ